MRDPPSSTSEVPVAALGMVGSSAAMVGIGRWLSKAAALQSPVVIEGEAGVGKMLAARALHALSDRRDAPLVVLEASQLTASTVLETLDRAAKSGAPGTVVLRRVEDLDARVQPILVRVLKERQASASGFPRLVATSFRSLQQAVRDGSFREDLYFRLSVLPLVVPPLRERKEDIPALVRFALGEDVLGRSRTLAAPAMARAESHPWPGNVRELIRMMHAARDRTGSTELGLDAVPELTSSSPFTTPTIEPVIRRPPPMFFGAGLLPPPMSLFEKPNRSMRSAKDAVKANADTAAGSGLYDLKEVSVDASGDGALPVSEHLPFKEAKTQLLVAFEREYLARLLKRCGGSITKTAQQSGLHRKSIERLVKKYQLKPRRRSSSR